MNWRNAAIVALVAMPLLVILALGFGTNPRGTPSVLEGKPAPQFQLPNLQGGKVSLAQLRGKPVVLNFWATWCEPCKVEHQLLQHAAKHYGSTVEFVGIVYQDTASAAEEYLKKRGSAYTQLHDVGSSVGVDYGVTGVPETFFVDAEGLLRRKYVGILNERALVENIESLQLPPLPTEESAP